MFYKQYTKEHWDIDWSRKREADGLSTSTRSWRRAQIMATMSMMKKALHMGMMDTDSAARIFFDDLPRLTDIMCHTSIMYQ
jgi:hypothetical protein